jgi:hypothetical protein
MGRFLKKKVIPKQHWLKVEKGLQQNGISFPPTLASNLTSLILWF